MASLLLAGATAAVIADALLRLLPLEGLRAFPEAAARACLAAATLAREPDLPATPLGDAPSRTAADPGILEPEPRRKAPLTADEAIFRALYAVNAAKRLFAGRGDFRAALDKERGHLALHREASARRRKAREVALAMVALHGPVLNWRHGALRTPEIDRPRHKMADGGNFDLRLGVPVFTGALPGALSGCTCAWQPPVEGAEMLR